VQRNNQRKASQSKKGRPPQGKHKPAMLQQQLKQQAAEPALRLSPLQPSVESGFEWTGSLCDYLTVLMLFSGTVSLSALTLVIASRNNGYTENSGTREASVGSSRPYGRYSFYAAPEVASAATMPKSAAQPLMTANPKPAEPQAPSLIPVFVPSPPDPDEPTMAEPMSYYVEPEEELEQHQVNRPNGPHPFIYVNNEGNKQVEEAKTYAIFRSILELQHGQLSLAGLHAMIQKDPQTLHTITSMENIAAPSQKIRTRQVKYSIRALNVSPVHYAFFIRMDAFALLLAQGANYDAEFSFENVENGVVYSDNHLVKGKLSTIFYDQYACFYAPHLCMTTASQELFLAFLNKKDFNNSIKMINFNLKKCHERVEKFSLSIEIETAKQVFSMLPSVEKIHLSMGDMSPDFYDYLQDIHMEWQLIKLNAERKSNFFKHYSAEALAEVLPQIESYLKCFVMLINNIDKHLTTKIYNERRLNRLLVAYQHYPRSNDVMVYYDSLRIKIQDACTRVFGGAKPERDSSLIEVMMHTVLPLVMVTDSPAYREAMHKVVLEQLNGYANQYKDSELQVLTARMSERRAPFRARILVDDITQAISHFMRKMLVDDRPVRLGK
jgi:hypothetical protein